MTLIRPSDASLDSPYWTGLADGKLLIQQCDSCSTYRHPPTPLCPNCHASTCHWAPVSGRGHIFSYTVAHHPVHPLLKSWVPYNIVVVALDEGPHLVSSLRDTSIDQLQVGAAVTCEIVQLAPGFHLPYFRPAKG